MTMREATGALLRQELLADTAVRNMTGDDVFGRPNTANQSEIKTPMVTFVMAGGYTRRNSINMGWNTIDAVCTAHSADAAGQLNDHVERVLRKITNKHQDTVSVMSTFLLVAGSDAIQIGTRKYEVRSTWELHVKFDDS